eukprot:3731805-Ditylum_brightwellii.AAC.1
MRLFNVEGRQAVSLLLLGTEEWKLSCDAGDGMVKHMRVVILASRQNGQLAGLWSSTTTMSPLSRRRNK